MKTLFSLILLMNLPAFADSQCDYVDPVKRWDLLEELRTDNKEKAENRVENNWILMLSFAPLQGALLTDIDFRRTDFRYADLRHTLLTGADLRCSNFEGANLARADLARADLRCSKNLEKAILTEANLEGAYIDSKYQHLGSLKGALNTDKINWAD